MKMFEYPLNAILIVKQFCDRKFHARRLPLHGTSLHSVIRAHDGTDAEIEIFDNLLHGFGLGEGTIAEGWIDSAVKFWENQMA
jgi:hypothetical protein